MNSPAAVVGIDPVEVIVELITGVEPGLDREVLRELVSGVAAGRVKRRRLAQTLAGRPSLLSDGRSPAPRVVGDLLLAVRRAGAVRISAPVCADCGKSLRSMQRRGQDWYCGGCGPTREPCAVCGRPRPVAVRDRAGRAHCVSCPPVDDGDPTEQLVGIVAGIDLLIPAPVVAAAAAAAAPRQSQRRQLAWALADRPELLTGAGAQAQLPAVLRLIDTLADHGAGRIIRPPCPHCGRVIALV